MWSRAVAVMFVVCGSLLAARAAQNPQAPPMRGAKVTFERMLAADQPREAQSRRVRLLSLGVERGETPSPLLSPGLFRATFRTMVTLPVRDRYRFRVDGRGSAKLSVNGEVVLDGVLRPGKPL
ncbi:MAG: PA14 domain-containing protein, partial [Planctomycetota bacterium]|nr:PA14 domain-containing protein [Planctomycetota bacterium]